MSVRSNKPSAGRSRGPARWTPLEVVLIVASLVLIAFPLYVEAYRWINPAAVPAAPRQQEQPTAEPATTAVPAATEVPAQPAATEVPAQPAATEALAATDVPAQPTVAGEPEARATLTPVPTAAPGATATSTPTATPTTGAATATPTTGGATATPTAPATATSTPGGSTSTPTATSTPGGPTETPTSTATATPTQNLLTPSATLPLDEPPLTLIKNASRTTARLGEELSFAIAVFTDNTSNENIEVRDSIDQQLDITSATASNGSCTISTGLVTCNVVAVLNSPASINITVRVRSDATPGARLRNQALGQDSRSFAASSDPVFITIEDSPVVNPTTAPTSVTNTPTPTTGPGTPTATPTSGSQPTATPTSSGGGGGNNGGGNSGGGNSGGETVQPPVVLPPTPIEGAPVAATQAPAQPAATARPRATAAPGGVTATRAAATATAGLPTLTPIVSSGDAVFFTLASDWGSAFPGQAVNFVVAARNNKTTEGLREVTVALTLPANIEITGAPTSSLGDPQISGNRVTLRLADLAVGQGFELTIPAKIKAGVAIDSRIVSQAEMTFTGLSTPLYSNIVPILVVGQAQQPTAFPTATTAPTTPPTATAVPTATTAANQPSSNAAATAVPASTATALPAQASGRPAAPTLPDTNSGVPISGVALLGMTMLIRTIRLHRAQSRI